MGKLADILNHRFLFITGKGGVGRTTLTAALARASAARGRRTLVATAHSAGALSSLLGTPVDCVIRNVAPNLDALAVDPRDSRNEYGRMILKFEPLYRAVFESAWVNRFLDAVPGLSEWAVLGKVTYHALESDYRTVIFDGPPTGHALAMLRLPGLISHAVLTGRLHLEAQKRTALFLDPDRSCFVLVASPDELAAREAMEAADVLQNDLGFPPPLLVINMVTRNPFEPAEEEMVASFPDHGEGSTHVTMGKARLHRCRREQRIISELVARFPSRHTQVLQRPDLSVGPEDLDAMMESLDKEKVDRKSAEEQD